VQAGMRWYNFPGGREVNGRVFQQTQLIPDYLLAKLKPRILIKILIII
jgi:hypothetical protein